MTRNFSSPWDQYVAIQANLARSTTVDDVAWGREHALDKILSSNGPVSAEEVELAARNESRRERHRAALRRRHAPVVAESAKEPIPMLEARQHLRLVQRLNQNESKLLNDLGAGTGYAELASRAGVTAGALRVRVQRARIKAMSLLAA